MRADWNRLHVGGTTVATAQNNSLAVTPLPQLKVLRSVVGLVAVDVVDCFVRAQRTTENSSHHLAMFKHVPSCTFNNHLHIAIAVDVASTFPKRTLGTGLVFQVAVSGTELRRVAAPRYECLAAMQTLDVDLLMSPISLLNSLEGARL